MTTIGFTFPETTKPVLPVFLENIIPLLGVFFLDWNFVSVFYY